MEYILTDKNAVPPKKGNEFASGYDISAIKIEKIMGKVFLLDTGLKIKPPKGYYFELYPRSSISKTPFSLANSIGVIDADYRGNLLIALRYHGSGKVQSNIIKEMGSFPWKVAQLIPKKIEDLDWESPKEVKELDKTERGSGGFGSTDPKRSFRNLGSTDPKTEDKSKKK